MKDIIVDGNDEKIYLGEKMMGRKIKVYTYRCINGSCRNIEERQGVNKTEIDCPQCGKRMKKIGTREIELD